MYLLLYVLLARHSFAQSLDYCSPVQLTKSLPTEEPEGTLIKRKCKFPAAGRKGKIVYGSMEDSETSFVKWDNSVKGCQAYEYYDYVAKSDLKVLGAAAPAKDCKKPPAPCNASHSETMEELLHKTDLADRNEFKKPEELEQYFACYATPEFNQYLNKYKFMIDSAAQEFGVEPALMKCLMFRESQWKKNTISCGCAIGIGQQLEENVTYIGGLLETEKKQLSKYPASSTLIAAPWERYMTKVKAKNPEWLNGCTGGFHVSQQAEKGGEYYNTQMKNLEPGCGKVPDCKIFQQDDRRCEAASIAADGAYLKTIQNLLPKGMQCHQIDWWQENDSMLAIALAYNAGEGTALKALKVSNSGLMSDNILDSANVSADKRKEMRGHYQAIFNCMQAGNTRPQTKKDPDHSACFKKTWTAGSTGATH
jgi:hypothetical protein